MKRGIVLLSETFLKKALGLNEDISISGFEETKDSGTWKLYLRGGNLPETDEGHISRTVDLESAR